MRESYGITDELLERVSMRHLQTREPEKATRLHELDSAISMMRTNLSSAMRQIGYTPAVEPKPY